MKVVVNYTLLFLVEESVTGRADCIVGIVLQCPWGIYRVK